MKEIDETDYDCINGVPKKCLHCLKYKNKCNCPRWRKICVNIIVHVEEKFVLMCYKTLIKNTKNDNYAICKMWILKK